MHFAANIDNLTQLDGAQPSLEEIARGTNLLEKQVEEILKLGSVHVTSLQEEVYEEDNGVVLGDLIADTSALGDVEETGTSEVNSESLLGALKQVLDPRQVRVIIWRFGLEDGRERTLEEIGREFGVTRERIRQLEERALRKLRKSKPFNTQFNSQQ